VQEGGGAQEAYPGAIHPETTEARRDELRQGLLDDCERDTLALIRVAKALSRLGEWISEPDPRSVVALRHVRRFVN
jgi:hypothetical protein